MIENENKLIEMIREQDNPDRALLKSLEIIRSYLEQHESFEEPSVVYFRELV